MSFFNRFRAHAHVEDELTLAELTIPIAGVDFTEVLEEAWTWLVNDTYKPFLMSAIGDLFFESPSGVIYWLDVGWGLFNPVADSRAEFEKMLTLPDAREELLSPKLVSALRARKPLKDHQCYSYTRPPFLGGKVKPSNFEPAPIFIHLDLFGHMLELVKDIPPGTRVRFEAKPKL
ncbi:MAG TPA: T6SS immunity protein Tdi1 domain-containing protein [Anaerolineales bacterium]|nr:T6SS immunity protein Tdi1 domain-containing protein [Anaerolineales bacterium]